MESTNIDAAEVLSKMQESVLVEGEAKRKRVKREYHGNYNTKAYNAWRDMKTRCQNPNHPAYKNYGGRGIAVCDRWQHFSNFLADMGNPPSKRLTLERIDSGGNYCPENCKWATRKEQANNPTNRRKVFSHRLGGSGGHPNSKSIAWIARSLGVGYWVLYGRMRRRNDLASAIESLRKS